MFRKLLFLGVLIYTTIEINNVTFNGGLVYVAVYSNEQDYKNEKAFVNFILQPTNATLTHSLDLPEGEYVVSVFQDKDGNGKLNEGIFGIPTEHVGKTNYSLRGSPGGFDKLKVPVNNNSKKLTVNIGRVKPLGII
ncbi:MAG: DUF2141 domain-containing protein [Fibromonadaceae bacterium]|jgi:uncharacterized protein (DUF2141 family)|nr:DUF2141 domain-containing protein [Fibromonadaceae bacterium]